MGCGKSKDGAGAAAKTEDPDPKQTPKEKKASIKKEKDEKAAEKKASLKESKDAKKKDSKPAAKPPAKGKSSEKVDKGKGSSGPIDAPADQEAGPSPKELQSATKIQATYRGRQGRKEVEEKKKTKDTKRPSAASIKSQEEAPRTVTVTADWTVKPGPAMEKAAWLWLKEGEQISDFCKRVELDVTATDPGSCKDVATISGGDLCKEEAYPDNFGDGEECDKIRVAMTQVAITFMRDQCTCKETYKPPSELAEQLAVWLWDSARVEQWLKEDVGILEEAEPQLYGGKVDGKLLLMKFEEGLFEGVEFEDGQKGQDMVRENLEGQCLSFFDVCVDEITGAADGEPAP